MTEKTVIDKRTNEQRTLITWNVTYHIQTLLTYTINYEYFNLCLERSDAHKNNTGKKKIFLRSYPIMADPRGRTAQGVGLRLPAF